MILNMLLHVIRELVYEFFGHSKFYKAFKTKDHTPKFPIFSTYGVKSHPPILALPIKVIHQVTLSFTPLTSLSVVSAN